MLPFFHSYGLQILLNGTLRRGTTYRHHAAIGARPSSCSSYKIGTLPRWLLCRPSYWRWLEHPLVDEFDLSSLVWWDPEAAPLGAALQADASKRLKVPVRQGYGMTEVVVAITGLPLKNAIIKPGSVGPLLA